MPTLLFWNVKRLPISRLVSALARQVRADIVALAEAHSDVNETLDNLNQGTTSQFFRDPIPSKGPLLFSRFLPKNIRSVMNGRGFVIREYSPPLGASFLVVVVHLPSKAHRDEHDYVVFSQQLVRAIERAEDQAGHTRTILIGDFNMNPFEPGMSSAGGLHAVMDRRIAAREARQLNGTEYKYFYNPMWSWLGDLRGRPSGTYFYDSGKAVNLYWNMLDQVLLRPSLLHAFTDDSVKIITEIDGTKLLDERGRPDEKQMSDHLPLVIELRKLEEKNEHTESVG